MKLKFSILLITLLCVIGMQAQYSPWSLNLKAGIGFSNVHVSADEAIDSRVKPGYQFGAYVDYTLPSNLFFQSGLIFQSKGAIYEDDNQYWSTTYNNISNDFCFAENDNRLQYQKVTVNSIYLQLPINVGYKYRLKQNMSIVILGGPYLAYGVGGKLTDEKVYADGVRIKEKDDVFGDRAWKRFDSGFSVTLGVELKKISLNMGYDFGMINIDRSFDVYNRSLFLNVGYRIF